MGPLGEPQGRVDVRAFLFTLLRGGRGVAIERVRAAGRHGRFFAGVSPITAITGRHADRIRDSPADLRLDLSARLGGSN